MECWSICLSLDRIYVSWPWFCQCSGLGWVSVRPRLCVGIDGVSLSVCKWNMCLSVSGGIRGDRVSGYQEKAFICLPVSG